MTVVLIDGDILIYKIPDQYTGEFTVEKCEEKEDCIYKTIAWASKAGVINFFKKKIAKIKAIAKAENVVICLSSANNFRKIINPNYKIKRHPLKPVVFDFARKFFRENFITFERENLEADDLIGIMATYKGNIKGIPKGERVIWSMDKDFKTIPCTFYKENKDGKITKFYISEGVADYNFMFQTLTGDSVDCYSGCKGIGAKKAQSILDNTDKTLKAMWSAVLKTYLEKGQTKEEALLNARCARILRAQDYDFKIKEIKLWEMVS